jgi:hypothetical protein
MDGQWIINEDKPTIKDARGNVNNVEVLAAP